MTKLQFIIDRLKIRLEYAEELMKMGLVPGHMDSIELERMRGRVAELSRVIELMTMELENDKRRSD